MEDGGEQLWVVRERNPVQHRSADDEVDRLPLKEVVQGLYRSLQELQVRRRPALRGVHHRPTLVDADHAAVWNECGELRRELPAAASQIDDHVRGSRMVLAQKPVVGGAVMV